MTSLFPPGRRRAVLGVALAVLASRANAQCPDGAPPPCRSARAVSALNPRAWIVVPFGNVTRSPDLDWLRDASVNLLTLEVGRWTDVQVVNDKRVGDLLQQLPAARRAGALTLNDGLDLARRAGAGMLVMGDFVKAGTGARLVANVFDVRTGNRLRTAQRLAPNADSLLAAFGPLSRDVLAVPPPPDAKSGEIGTSHLDAYQEYLTGVRALNRFDLPEARTRLARALDLDSAFALAHLQLANTLGWSEVPADRGLARAHALTAQRLGNTLPPRERALIAAAVAVSANDFLGACDALRPVVMRDSADAQALYAFGDCLYHDSTIDLVAGDSTTGRFRTSWNLALRSLERALDLDPSNHQAFQHIVDILRAPARVGCAPGRPGAACVNWSALVLVAGDSLSMVPYRAATLPWQARRRRAQLERPLVINLERARRIAENWVASDSTSVRARYGLAVVLLAQGNIAESDRQLAYVPARAVAEDVEKLRMHTELAIKLGKRAEARAWFDSIVKAVPDRPDIVTARGAVELNFGKVGRFMRGASATAQANGPAAAAYAQMLPWSTLGLANTDVIRAEAAYDASLPDTVACDGACRVSLLFPTLGFALAAPRARWPRLNGKLGDWRFILVQAVSVGDTAAARRAAWVLDSTAHASVQAGEHDFGWAALAAEGYLAIRDSAAALKLARFYVDTAMAQVPLAVAFAGGGGMTYSALWPRMILLRARLAAAAGKASEARKSYDRILDFWSDADPELQPEVLRIRAARAALGTMP